MRGGLRQRNAPGRRIQNWLFRWNPLMRSMPRPAWGETALASAQRRKTSSPWPPSWSNCD